MGWRVRRGRRSSRIKAERRRGGLRGHHPFPRPRALGSLLLSPLRDPGRAYSLWSLTRHGDEGKWGEEGKKWSEPDLPRRGALKNCSLVLDRPSRCQL